MFSSQFRWTPVQLVRNGLRAIKKAPAQGHGAEILGLNPYG
jgi:hypothetical protein